MASEAVLGTARARRHAYTLPATELLPALDLDLLVASAPADVASEAEAFVLYVLDPEPILFGAACLACYAGGGYFASAHSDAPERVFHNLHVVGIGHRSADFSANPRSWDVAGLRDLRRRDFPPHNHPSRDPTRQANEHSRRLASALSELVFAHAERQLLGLDRQHVAGRALLGASYSAALALQVFLHENAPGAQRAMRTTNLILGSPSLPFDPELIEQLRAMPTAEKATDESCAALIAYGALEREPPPPADSPQVPTPGVPFTGDRRNVHRHIPDAAHELADVLAARGVAVDGAHSIAGEDHTSLKLSLVSRGISWLCEGWGSPRGRKRARDDGKQ